MDKTESSEPDASITSEPVYVQEPQKARGTVGEKIWGPYKTHAGSDITSKYAGGPWGLGDPEDKTLRKVEQNILIHNMLKKNVKNGYCKSANDKFFKCAEEYGLWRMTYQCREEAKKFRDCVTKMMENKDEIEKATNEYLEMRSEYRRTGKRLPLKRS